MKTIKQIFLIILLCASYNTVTLSQNLDSMAIAKRDSLLIAIAKEVVLKHGPDYYREDFKPIIERHGVPPKGELNKTGEMAGRIFYRVIFRYDENKEQLNYPFAARVQILADTGKPRSVVFGNGLALTFSDSYDLRNDTTNVPIRYQELKVSAIYSLSDPDPNRKPKNLDELQRKGYVERGNGQWEKTSPDTPPAEALKVIERAKEEMRKKMENK